MLNPPAEDVILHRMPELWPAYWNAELRAETRKSLEEELYRELTTGHVLFGQTVSAKALCGSGDDVVYQLQDGRYAVVHLTWHVEKSSEFPFTLVFSDLDSLGRHTEWD